MRLPFVTRRLHPLMSSENSLDHVFIYHNPVGFVTSKYMQSETAREFSGNLLFQRCSPFTDVSAGKATLTAGAMSVENPGIFASSLLVPQTKCFIAVSGIVREHQTGCRVKRL